jgi:hypothetical protein
MFDTLFMLFDCRFYRGSSNSGSFTWIACSAIEISELLLVSLLTVECGKTTFVYIVVWKFVKPETPLSPSLALKVLFIVSFYMLYSLWDLGVI